MNAMKPIGSHSQNLILSGSAGRSEAGGSKDGSGQGRRLWPSFETHRFRDVPQDEGPKKLHEPQKRGKLSQ
jgi:hypothetical protein